MKSKTPIKDRLKKKIESKKYIVTNKMNELYKATCDDPVSLDIESIPSPSTILQNIDHHKLCYKELKKEHDKAMEQPNCRDDITNRKFYEYLEYMLNIQDCDKIVIKDSIKYNTIEDYQKLKKIYNNSN